jgi:CobQ-like glutamine amidotransferase family enzyme
LRLGTSLPRNPDIYSLLVAAQFKASIIDLHKWEANMAEQAAEEMVTNFKKT